MSGQGRLFAVQPVLSYPRRARAGENYLLTIDLLPLESDAWPYEREEYAVYCMLDTMPLFEHQALGTGAVVLHRFGGTYGPARFVLTACDVQQIGSIRVTLANGWGLPIHVLELPGIQIGGPPSPPGERVHLRGQSNISGGRLEEKVRSPYRGLASFTEDVADLYFGFDSLINQVWQEIASHRSIVFVEGEPNSGKSSLLHAGVIPRCRQEGLKTGSRWKVASFTPGKSPYESLKDALVRAETDPDDARRLQFAAISNTTVEGHVGNLIATFTAQKVGSKKHHLVVIDQFEEFYTRCRNAREREAVFNGLLAASEQNDVRLVVAIRKEDLGLLSIWENTLKRQGNTHITLVAPDVRVFREISLQPAERLGYRFQDGLLDRILNDQLLTPDSVGYWRKISGGGSLLALLELALQQLWRKTAARGSKEFSHADYDQLGGIGAALSQWAENAYSRLPEALPNVPQTQELARRLFTGLRSKEIIVPRSRSELEHETGNASAAVEIVEYLVQAGLLLLLTGNPDRAVTRVAVAQGIFLDNWPRMREFSKLPGPKPPPDRAESPLFLVPFNKAGACSDELVRKALVNAASQGEYTDILMLVHGWNVDGQKAVEFCNHFFTGFLTLFERDNRFSIHRRPLLAGVAWESASFVLPWERLLPSAGTVPEADAIAEDRNEIRQIANDLETANVPRFYDLAERKEGLSEKEGLELARILAPLYEHPDPENPQVGNPTPTDLLRKWEERRRQTTNIGNPVFPSTVGPSAGSGPPFRGLFDFRDILRMTTVWQMRERAGSVGARGVSQLLRDLLAANPKTRIHLIGHSLGCRVLLAALCAMERSRPVDSLLLLQPAVSYLCFARDITGEGHPGEFRSVLDRVVQPIMTTHSKNDQPLTQIYQWIMRVSGESSHVRIEVPPPGRYGALGGFGPRGCDDDCSQLEMKIFPDLYDLKPSGPRLLVLNGDRQIQSHSDISNQAVWWALCNLVDPRTQ